MDDASLRDLLNGALAGEPPIGQVAQNSLRAGLRLRRRRRVRAAAGTVAVVAAAAVIPAGTGAVGRLFGPAGRPATPVVYVLVQHGQSGSGTGTVIPISTATGKPGKPITVGPNPDFIAITPDGRTAYVASAGTSDMCQIEIECSHPSPATVTPIRTATNTAGKPIHVAADQIAITPDGKTAYALNENTVIPISTATNTPGKPFTDVYQPSQMAITPDGKTAYITHPINQITPVDTATNAEGKPIHVVRGPGFIAFTPDSKTAYVASDGNPPAVAPAVTPISTAGDRPGAPIPIGVSGRAGASYAQIQIAVTPGGKTVYLDDVVYRSDTVLPISTATNTAGKRIRIGAAPAISWLSPQCYMVFTPGGKTAYVAALHSVVPVSTSTNRPGRPIQVGTGQVSALVIVP